MQPFSITHPPIFIISEPFKQHKYLLYRSLNDSIVREGKNPANFN